MLGAQQKAWFKQTLAGSPQTWKLWANEVMLMGFQSAPQNGANNDQWDGYAAERKELLDFVLANNVKNLLPLTGDIHNFFVGTATTDGSDTGTPVCGEFVGGSTTSLGLPEETGISSATIQALINALDHHISYNDLDRPRLRGPRGLTQPGDLRVQEGADAEPRRRTGVQHRQVRPAERLGDSAAGGS